MATEILASAVAVPAAGDAHLITLGRQHERLLREWEEARAQALALAETSWRMDEFLGIASHELRAPVTSSGLSVKLAARHLHSLSDQVVARGTEWASQLATIQELLTKAEEDLQRLTRLVVDLLDVSRIRAGQLQLRPVRCDLNHIVREAVEEHRQLVPARTIRLHLSASKTVPVVADADRIRQAVTNYLTNAAKYSPADQPVNVRVQVCGNWARVVVRDEGPGLPRDEQQHIWERFHRAAGVEAVSDDSAGAGLGLGLHICKTIIEGHQGQVGVRSAPGRGSTFWFALVLAGVDRHLKGRTGIS